ncbi:MAG: hypothetical protein JWM21_1410 [Acidobacteria bacterium]|nr:hypothetical protein [Acidobacteriota bacterium]
MSGSKGNKAWTLIESPLLLAGVALVLALFGKRTALFIAWILFSAAVVRTQFFANRSRTFRWVGNGFLSLILAIVLFVIWLTQFADPTTLLALRGYTSHVATLLPWRSVFIGIAIGFLLTSIKSVSRGPIPAKEPLKIAPSSDDELARLNLESKVARLEKRDMTWGIQVNAGKGDIKRLQDANTKLQTSFESERLAFKGQLATAQVRIEERDAELAKAKEHIEGLSSLKITYSNTSPYHEIIKVGRLQRINIYIGVSSDIPIEGLTVEIDGYRADIPQNPEQRRPYQLCEKDADDPFKPVSITSGADVKTFHVITAIYEDVGKVRSDGNCPTITVRTTDGDLETFPWGWFFITARGHNVLPRRVRVTLALPRFSANVYLQAQP